MSDEFDLGRYESAAGWEPEDPHKKQREAIRKQRLLEPDPSDSMLEIRPASKWILPGSKQRPSAELFGSLWREGEVAVLFGETGVGKSVLAAQISESIARGGRGMKAEGGRMKNGNSSFHPSSLILHPSSLERQRSPQGPLFRFRTHRAAIHRALFSAVAYSGQAADTSKVQVRTFGDRLGRLPSTGVQGRSRVSAPLNLSWDRTVGFARRHHREHLVPLQKRFERRVVPSYDEDAEVLGRKRRPFDIVDRAGQTSTPCKCQ